MHECVVTFERKRKRWNFVVLLSKCTVGLWKKESRCIPHHHQPGTSAILVMLSFEIVEGKIVVSFWVGALVGLPGNAKLPPCVAAGWNAPVDPPKIFQFCGLPTAPKSMLTPPFSDGLAKLLRAWLKIPSINPPNPPLPKPSCFPVAPVLVPVWGWLGAAAVGFRPAGRLRDESSPKALLSSLMVTKGFKKTKKIERKCYIGFKNITRLDN